MTKRLEPILSCWTFLGEAFCLLNRIFLGYKNLALLAPPRNCYSKEPPRGRLGGGVVPVCHLRSRLAIPLLAQVVLPGSFVLSVFDSAKFSSSCAYSPTSKEKQNPPTRF